jgi:hypothetical protein
MKKWKGSKRKLLQSNLNQYLTNFQEKLSKTMKNSSVQIRHANYVTAIYVPYIMLLIADNGFFSSVTETQGAAECFSH